MRDSICNDCAKRTRCDMAEIGRSPLAISTCYGYEKGNPTNYDSIVRKSPEELAFLISNGCPPASVKPCRAYLSIDGDTNCADCWLDWLKQEEEE